MLDHVARFVALMICGERMGLLQLNLQIHIELAGSAFFERNKARGQFLLRLIVTPGIRQIARKLKNQCCRRIRTRKFL